MTAGRPRTPDRAVGNSTEPSDYLADVAARATDRIRRQRREYLRIALQQRGLTLPDDPGKLND